MAPLTLRRLAMYTVAFFAVFTCVLFFIHESHIAPASGGEGNKIFNRLSLAFQAVEETAASIGESIGDNIEQAIQFNIALPDGYPESESNSEGEELDDTEEEADDKVRIHSKATEQSVGGAEVLEDTTHGQEDDDQVSPSLGGSNKVSRDTLHALGAEKEEEEETENKEKAVPSPSSGSSMTDTLLHWFGMGRQSTPATEFIAPDEDDFNDDSVSVTTKDAQGNIVVLQKSSKPRKTHHSTTVISLKPDEKAPDDDFDDDSVSRTSVRKNDKGIVVEIVDEQGRKYHPPASLQEQMDRYVPPSPTVVPTMIPIKEASTLIDNSIKTHHPRKAPVGSASKPSHSAVQEQVQKSDIAQAIYSKKKTRKLSEKRGTLICDGKSVDSEVIYWKDVSGDKDYESPITPHHDNHHDRYFTYEYDQGGWNNIRMALETIMVIAHVTGRTVVVPPQAHLYLLDAVHSDKTVQHKGRKHDEMSFADFFDLDLLRSQKGVHLMEMSEFMNKEAMTGGLNHIYPPNNSSGIWGRKLWKYLDTVADGHPEWMGRFLLFPDKANDYDHVTNTNIGEKVTQARAQRFGGGRSTVYYDSDLRNAHHIHFPADHNHRLLQHAYAFNFFSDIGMASFYKRFLRDYMRYRDEIHCAGAQLLSYVRQESLNRNKYGKGDFYALHVRRGDFQFKPVKISAQDIVDNLVFPNGTAIIPRGSVVYLSTDDPDGICKHCVASRKPCDTYPRGQKPVGCQEDPSWNAFKLAGWEVIMLRDFLNKGALKEVNPNFYGMAESIVCSRAKAFAGTYFSTFTGYIHRLRGYHGLGEDTYYHSKQHLMMPRSPRSIGHGFSREYRHGWTDDSYGENI